MAVPNERETCAVATLRPVMLLRGAWVDHVERRGGYAYLRSTTTGQRVMADRAAVLKACVALGIRVGR